MDNLFDERTCRVCGCTDDHACPGGCCWVEDDLCSACVDNLVWVSVKEGRPSQAIRVLVSVKFGHAKYVTVGCMQLNKWLLEGPIDDAEVTHWMPLPSLPGMRNAND